MMHGFDPGDFQWTGDNLNVLRGMNSESGDLIYLAPPSTATAPTAKGTRTQAELIARLQTQCYGRKRED